MAPEVGIGLDVDDTLSNTALTFCDRLLKEFPIPGATPESLFRQYGYVQNVPQFRNDKVLTRIHELRKSNGGTVLGIMEGAHEGVSMLHHTSNIPVASYVTTRSVSHEQETLEWIDAMCFPIADIICRPTSVSFEYGDQWKGQLIPDLHPTNGGRISGFIDNSYDVARHLPADYIGVFFLLDWQNLGNPRSDSVHVIACSNWEKAVEAVEHRRDLLLAPEIADYYSRGKLFNRNEVQLDC